jgi:intracellular sulfur oxidation DsrE/DsrF family protein
MEGKLKLDDDHKMFLPSLKINMTKLIVVLLASLMVQAQAQQRVNPIIKSAGGIFPVPDAVEKPDPDIAYKIVIELWAPPDNAKEVHQSINNVARLINLHAVGGVPREKLDIVVAIHGEATYSITDSKTYEQRYKTANPNIKIYEELAQAGVKLFVCGQSLVARQVERSTIIPEIKIATSMLTTVTTHQLKGYAYLKLQ